MYENLKKMYGKVCDNVKKVDKNTVADIAVGVGTIAVQIVGGIVIAAVVAKLQRPRKEIELDVLLPLNEE